MGAPKFLRIISKGLVKGRIVIIIVFAVMVAAFSVCCGFVNINYDDTYYLPDDSNTKQGLVQMQKSFGASGNASAMIKDSDIGEIISLKGAISNIEGVDGVIWVDDIFLPLLDDGLQAVRDSGTHIADSDIMRYLFRALKVVSECDAVTAGDMVDALKKEFTSKEIIVMYRIVKNLNIEGFDFSQYNLKDEAVLRQKLPPEYKTMVASMKSQMESFYKDGNAMFQIVFTNDDYAQSTTQALKKIDSLSDNLYLTGNAATTYYSQQSQNKDIIIGMSVAIVVVLIILFAFSSSWFEPLLYIFTIGVAVVINLGSNIILPKVSYMTNSVACILQLVLSMDYAIVLISRYKTERSAGKDKKSAAADALANSIFPIATSSLTTIACFITIMFMNYKLGFDMGVVMTKGIVLSLLTVFLLLPGLLVICDKPIVAGEHKSFNVNFNKFAKFQYKLRFIIPVLAILIVIPSVFAANNNTFTYGVNASQGEKSTAIVNLKEVEKVFGTQEQLALLVPADDEKELELSNKLLAISGKQISMVNSYQLIKQSGFTEMLPESFIAQFKGRNGYDRIILTLNVPEEGEQTKKLLKKIEDTTKSVYSNEKYYLLGNTAAAIDMEQSTNEDFNKISLISLGVVAAVIFISYQSLLIPVMLITIIESGIFVNMAVPYLMHEPVIFIGYMIISNILLGATIDYGIIMTSNYLEARIILNKKEALTQALNRSFKPLLISAGIFTVGGLVIGLCMNSSAVRMLGMSIMRGGICSFAMTVFVLPAFLVLFDKPVNSWRSLLFKKNRQKAKENHMKSKAEKKAKKEQALNK